jgi:GxxExxY protein
LDELSHAVIGIAIGVHRALGPGLLESAYELCLTHDLKEAGLRVASQVPVSICYRGLVLDACYRLDLVVEDRLVLELKAVDQLLPLHRAQLLSYLRLSNYPVGLLMNFHVPVLRHGIHRFVHGTLERIEG